MSAQPTPLAPLILASNSSVRGALLAAAHLPFTKHPAQIDERALEEELALHAVPAPQVAIQLAQAKALAVSALVPEALTIGADQTLDCDGRRFHKPAGRAEAHEQLTYLAGKTHRLSSAVALAQNGTILWSHVAEVRLTVRALDAAAIDRYLDAAGEAVLTSVGAYQLEGLGVRLFTDMSGDYFTVLGLPLLPLLAELEKFGYVL